MNIVAAILTTKKAPTLLLTMTAMAGFNSLAPAVNDSDYGGYAVQCAHQDDE